MDRCFHDIAWKWLEESRGVMGEETLGLYGGLLEHHVEPWFGPMLEAALGEAADSADKPLPAVTEGEVRAFMDAKRAEGMAESSVWTLVRLLRRVLEYGAALGVFAAPSWDGVAGSAEKKFETVILTPAEERQLADYLVDHPSGRHLLLFLMLTAGLRMGEAVALRWADVSVSRGEILVRTERGPSTGRQKRVRTVPIGERQKLYLRKLSGPQGHYVGSGTAVPLDRTQLANRFRLIVREQVLPPLSPTCLRHTYAVRCLEAGMDYEQLSRRLGLVNDFRFRQLYRELVSPQLKERLERERFAARKVRQAPATIRMPEKDPEVAALETRIDTKKRQLKETLDSLEGDLAIIRALRNSDGVQGQAREGFYRFIEKVLGEDKDGKILVEYLRSNMRVAEMPSRANLSVQAIRRRVSHGFAKLTARLEALQAVVDKE